MSEAKALSEAELIETPFSGEEIASLLSMADQYAKLRLTVTGLGNIVNVDDRLLELARALEILLRRTHKTLMGRVLVDNRQFPIIAASGRFTIPWAVIAPFEDVCKANHAASLERVAERGGLSIGEAIDVLKGQKWATTKHATVDDLLSLVRQRESNVDIEKLSAENERLRKLVYNQPAS